MYILKFKVKTCCYNLRVALRNCKDAQKLLSASAFDLSNKLYYVAATLRLLATTSVLWMLLFRQADPRLVKQFYKNELDAMVSEKNRQRQLER